MTNQCFVVAEHLPGLIGALCHVQQPHASVHLIQSACVRDKKDLHAVPLLVRSAHGAQPAGADLEFDFRPACQVLVIGVACMPHS
jgi:hypothetical protein